VPAATILAANDALQTGQVVPVPAVPAEGTPATIKPLPPQPGPLYGKLLVPFTLEGKVLPAGGYIQLAYEQGDSWVLSNSYVNPAIISKAAVELVEHTNFFSPLTGTINSPTRVYKLIPDIRRDPSTLDQSEIFSNMNPAVNVGDEVSITAREGDDYLIQITQPGRMSKLGRVPVSAVDITYGNPSSGTPVFIPPRPQNEDASAPGYVASPPKPVEPGSIFLEYILPFMVISTLVAIVGFIYRRMANASTAKPGEADYGVPHAKFAKTKYGFSVTFIRSSEAFYRTTHVVAGSKASGGVALIFYAIMILFLFILLLWYGIESFLKTVITVDSENVTIGGKKMARRDFGSFNVAHSISGPQGEIGVLGYTFGRRALPFGGVWDHGQAQEVASALNDHLRSTPMAGDEHSPSPEALRTARPTDF
jgi:hypothetical protein